jgi:hypothetical protein
MTSKYHVNCLDMYYGHNHFKVDRCLFGNEHMMNTETCIKSSEDMSNAFESAVTLEDIQYFNIR